jgi:hypothetical protein
MRGGQRSARGLRCARTRRVHRPGTPQNRTFERGRPGCASTARRPELTALTLGVPRSPAPWPMPRKCRPSSGDGGRLCARRQAMQMGPDGRAPCRRVASTVSAVDAGGRVRPHSCWPRAPAHRPWCRHRVQNVVLPGRDVLLCASGAAPRDHSPTSGCRANQALFRPCGCGPQGHRCRCNGAGPARRQAAVCVPDVHSTRPTPCPARHRGTPPARIAVPRPLSFR